MAFDTTRWLQEEMGFTAEQAAQLAPQFADRADRLEAGYVGSAARQQFDAQRAEIASTQQALKDANDKLNREMAEWASLTAAEKAQATELQNSLEAARVRVAQIETRLQTTAQQYGFDPKTILEGTAVIPEKKEPVAQPIDTKQFVNRDQIVPVLDYQMDFAAALPVLVADHQALFGERLDTRDLLKEVRTRAAKNDGNIDPFKVWEEKYGVPAKRQQVADEKYKADIAAAEARGREAGLSERAMPGPADPGRHAPIFRNGSGQFAPRTSRLQRPQPETSVRSAAAALATGKYRTPDNGARG